MIERLKYSMRALQVLSRAQEITSNNLANINTAGFKRDSLFYRAYEAKVSNNDMVDPIAHQYMDSRPGSLEQTGNLFDFAVSGDGFFQVNYEGETMLTRNGRFYVDNDGFMRDESGGYVQGAAGDIFIPQINDFNQLNNIQNKIEVAQDGTIRVNDDAVDKIQLVRVDDPSTLERRTNSYLAPTAEASIDYDYESHVLQGFYESGNVNALEEMVAMATNTRLFESQQRNLRTTDDVLSKVTNNLSRF